jgi:hypothetical protein
MLSIEASTFTQPGARGKSRAPRQCLEVQLVGHLYIHGLAQEPVPSSCEEREGRKLLMGDNLSSHMSIKVISWCKEHDIAFVCLPANSADKPQLLDVSLFAL